jgi:hypothetical protein
MVLDADEIPEYGTQIVYDDWVQWFDSEGDTAGGMTGAGYLREDVFHAHYTLREEQPTTEEIDLGALM